MIYVGMAGRSLAAGAHELPEAQLMGRPRGLRDRLNSHASGRRSGDQFCVYICDRLVLPTLTQDEIQEVARGALSLDARTRIFIRDQLSYRFVVTDDKAEARELERLVRTEGLSGQAPLLNPGTTAPKRDSS